MDGSFEPCKGQRVCWTAVSSLGHAQHDKRYVSFNYNPGQNVCDTVFQVKKMHFKLTPPPQAAFMSKYCPFAANSIQKHFKKGLCPKTFWPGLYIPHSSLKPCTDGRRKLLRPFARSTFDGFKLCTPTTNSTQQHATGCANGRKHVTSNDVCHFAD